MRMEKETALSKVGRACMLVDSELTPNPGTVLVIDDDDHVRKLCCRCLAGAGFRVLDADNGFDALLIAAKHDGRIDMLITDVEMPQIDGPELVQAFQALWPATKVLFISGCNDAGRAELNPEAAFLEKPFTPQKLVRTVDSALGG